MTRAARRATFYEDLHSDLRRQAVVRRRHENASEGNLSKSIWHELEFSAPANPKASDLSSLPAEPGGDRRRRPADLAGRVRSREQAAVHLSTTRWTSNGSRATISRSRLAMWATWAGTR